MQNEIKIKMYLVYNRKITLNIKINEKKHETE